MAAALKQWMDHVVGATLAVRYRILRDAGALPGENGLEAVLRLLTLRRPPPGWIFGRLWRRLTSGVGEPGELWHWLLLVAGPVRPSLAWLSCQQLLETLPACLPLVQLMQRALSRQWWALFFLLTAKRR